MSGTERQEQRHGLRGQIRGAFDKVVSRVNPTEEDRVWDQYMGKRRDWRELVGLLQQEDTQPEYQHRALQTLLAPDISSLPFAANLDTGLGTYVGVSNHWMDRITDEQAGFVAGLLPNYIEQARQTADRDEHSYSAREALFTYNDLISKLLPKLPPEQAERLFEYFSLNDPLSYWNMDTSSGYNPLRSLYHSQAVDESWKRRAANQIHAVIEREQRGETKPRVEHEAAARCYGSILGMMLYGDKLPVSKEFYQDEIAFMLGVEVDRPIVDLWHTGSVLSLLDYPELKHRFARLQVLTGDPESLSRFNVYDEAGAATARRILTEFPDDQELNTYLEQQLAEWQVRSEQNRQRQEQEARTEQEIALSMKRSTN